MSILISGATGFVGSELVKKISISKKKIVLISRKKKSSKIKHITWKKIDICKKKKNLYDYLNKPDSLIHLAWDGLDLRDYDNNIHLNQVECHYNFIKKLIENGVKNILIAGTCQEYGNYKGLLPEDLKPKPITKYGKAKNLLRKKIEKLKKYHNFNLSWVRIFYFYGGSIKQKNIWGQINTAVKRENKTFKMTSGSQYRDYVHLDFIINSLIKINKNNHNHGVVNICSNNPVRVIKLVNTWIKKYKWKIKLNLNEKKLKINEKYNFWGSNKKLKKILR